MIRAEDFKSIADNPYKINKLGSDYGLRKCYSALYRMIIDEVIYWDNSSNKLYKKWESQAFTKDQFDVEIRKSLSSLNHLYYIYR